MIGPTSTASDARAQVLSRRGFLRGAGALGVAGLAGPLASSRAHADEGCVEGVGPLSAADANGLMLPAGFTSRVVATTGQNVAGTSHVWHTAPDGGATFATPGGGWIYVSNSESPPGRRRRDRVRRRTARSSPPTRSSRARSINCAGGPTPWGTWLSCEEFSAGRVWECDPFTPGSRASRGPRSARFQHEAAAVAPDVAARVPDRGPQRRLLYRFTPTSYPSLAAGTLAGGADPRSERAGPIQPGQVRPVAWHAVPNPNPSGSQTATRYQVPVGDDVQRRRGLLVSRRASSASPPRATTASGSSIPPRTRSRSSTTTPPRAIPCSRTSTTSTRPRVATSSSPKTPAISRSSHSRRAGSRCRSCGSWACTGTEITGPALSPDGSRLYFSSQRNPGGRSRCRGPSSRRRSRRSAARGRCFCARRARRRARCATRARRACIGFVAGSEARIAQTTTSGLRDVAAQQREPTTDSPVDGSGMKLIVVTHPSVSPFGIDAEARDREPIVGDRARLGERPSGDLSASPFATSTSISEYIVPPTQMNASDPRSARARADDHAAVGDVVGGALEDPAREVAEADHAGAALVQERLVAARRLAAAHDERAVRAHAERLAVERTAREIAEPVITPVQMNASTAVRRVAVADDREAVVPRPRAPGCGTRRQRGRRAATGAAVPSQLTAWHAQHGVAAADGVQPVARDARRRRSCRRATASRDALITATSASSAEGLRAGGAVADAHDDASVAARHRARCSRRCRAAGRRCPSSSRSSGMPRVRCSEWLSPTATVPSPESAYARAVEVVAARSPSGVNETAAAGADRERECARGLTSGRAR